MFGQISCKKKSLLFFKPSPAFPHNWNRWSQLYSYSRIVSQQFPLLQVGNFRTGDTCTGRIHLWIDCTMQNETSSDEIVLTKSRRTKWKKGEIKFHTCIIQYCTIRKHVAQQNWLAYSFICFSLQLEQRREYWRIENPHYIRKR